MKTFKKTLISILALVLLTQLVACDLFEDGGITIYQNTTKATESGTPASGAPVTPPTSGGTSVNPIDNLLENEAVPLSTPEVLTKKYTDGINNYFYVKLGTVKNVLTFSYNQYMYDGRLNPVYEWKTTETVEDVYATVNNKTLTNTTKMETVANVDTKVSANAKATYGGLSAGVSGEVSAGLKSSLSNTTSVSFSEQFSTTMKTKVENVKSTTYEFKPGMQAGFYRYSFYSNVDVYAALVCNLSSKTINYVYITVPVDGTSKEGFRYSATGDFPQANTPDLALTADMLSSLDIDYFSEELEEQEKTTGFAQSNESFLVTPTNGRAIWADGRELLETYRNNNSYSTLKIQLVYDVQSPKGDCTSKMSLFSSSNRNDSTKIASNDVHVNGTYRSITKEYSISTARFAAGDGYISAEFHATGDGKFDLVNNTYNILRYELTLTLIP